MSTGPTGHPRVLRGSPAGTLTAALVLSGQLRSFQQTAVHNSILRMGSMFMRADSFMCVSLIDSFMTAGASAHIMGDGDRRTAERKVLSRKGRHRSLSDPDIQVAMAKLRPVTVLTFNDSDVPCLAAGPCHRVPHSRPDGHWTYYWPMFWAERRAYQLMVSHEDTVGQKYEVVLRIRPDIELILQQHIPIWKTWQPFAVVDIHQHMDVFAIATRAAAGVYFNAAKYFHSNACAALEQTVNALPPGQPNATCDPSWATQCFLHSILAAHSVRQAGWSTLPHGMSTKIRRPADVSEQLAPAQHEVWPNTCESLYEN